LRRQGSRDGLTSFGSPGSRLDIRPEDSWAAAADLPSAREGGPAGRCGAARLGDGGRMRPAACSRPGQAGPCWGDFAAARRGARRLPAGRRLPAAGRRRGGYPGPGRGSSGGPVRHLLCQRVPDSAAGDGLVAGAPPGPAAARRRRPGRRPGLARRGATRPADSAEAGGRGQRRRRLGRWLRRPRLPGGRARQPGLLDPLARPDHARPGRRLRSAAYRAGAPRPPRGRAEEHR